MYTTQGGYEGGITVNNTQGGYEGQHPGYTSLYALMRVNLSRTVNTRVIPQGGSHAGLYLRVVLMRVILFRVCYSSRVILFRVLPTVHILLGADALLRPCALFSHNLHKVDNPARTECSQLLFPECGEIPQWAAGNNLSE